MNTSEATRIFKNIYIADDKTFEEKGEAILEVMGMETHNGITKEEMLNVIRWLWNQCFTLEVADSE